MTTDLFLLILLVLAVLEVARNVVLACMEYRNEKRAERQIAARRILHGDDLPW